MDKQNIYNLDTNLRTGQKSPGEVMSFEDNSAYADIDATIIIVVIDVGFQSANYTTLVIIQS
ncbi:citramalate synthase [Francisella tularensis]|uniref:citramalate synthase n=1 Tax=Francisella tularensis TaxID=263 RepID=UPI001748B47D|nr:citramalate synthase [Francisella tularensis]MBD5784306.1 citramalate synthase [Francisella tularensis subsp. holarctica]